MTEEELNRLLEGEPDYVAKMVRATANLSPSELKKIGPIRSPLGESSSIERHREKLKRFAWYCNAELLDSFPEEECPRILEDDGLWELWKELEKK
jgi:hypothetical protein